MVTLEAVLMIRSAYLSGVSMTRKDRGTWSFREVCTITARRRVCANRCASQIAIGYWLERLQAAYAVHREDACNTKSSKKPLAGTHGCVPPEATDRGPYRPRFRLWNEVRPEWRSRSALAGQSKSTEKYDQTKLECGRQDRPLATAMVRVMPGLVLYVHLISRNAAAFFGGSVVKTQC